VTVFQHAYMQHALLAGVFAGILCGIAGVFVVTMHLSFLGVCIAHAAFAGAMLSLCLEADPLLGAVVFSLGASAVVGPLADRGELSPDSSIGIVFSLMLALAFLFMGLIPGSRSAALNLMWGNILSVGRLDLLFLFLTAALLVGVLALFFKEVQAVVCHRNVALAVGIPATAVFYGTLFATGLTVAVTLSAVGGLLIYCLLIIPASAAFQLTYSLKRMFVLSCAFGVLSCWIGLGASYLWDLQAGATIVIAACGVFAVAALLSPKRKGGKWKPVPSGK